MVTPWRLIRPTGLACLLLFLVMLNLPTPVLAQPPERLGLPPSQAPNAVSTTRVDSNKTGTAGSLSPLTGQTERISIRIEFPLVEPMFDIFYPREEPRIEADAIAPITNPLLELPPSPEKLPQGVSPQAEEQRASRIAKPQILLDRLRE